MVRMGEIEEKLPIRDEGLCPQLHTHPYQKMHRFGRMRTERMIAQQSIDTVSYIISSPRLKTITQ